MVGVQTQEYICGEKSGIIIHWVQKVLTATAYASLFFGKRWQGRKEGEGRRRVVNTPSWLIAIWHRIISMYWIKRGNDGDDGSAMVLIHSCKKLGF